ADIYLGTAYIRKATGDKNGQILGSYNYPANDYSNSRSIRFSERHNTQLGYEWYLANADHTNAAKLYNNLIDDGYQVHRDIYSPLFGTDTTFADNYQYDSGPNGVYRDCYIEPAMTDISYQYHSKVCAFGVDFYVWFSKNNDWLVPTLWAIHLLNKYHSPDTEYYNGGGTEYSKSWWSPREVARFDETKWINIGIESPEDKTVASSVRTAVFEVLETILGHRYGDTTSRAFSDRAAHALALAQVKSDGTILEYDKVTGTTNSYQRANDIGAFYTAWTQPFVYVTTVSPIKQLLEWLFSHPDESGDIKPSNAETTFTVAQALRVYDCYKYGYNCANTPNVTAAPTNVTSAKAPSNVTAAAPTNVTSAKAPSNVTAAAPTNVTSANAPSNVT